MGAGTIGRVQIPISWRFSLSLRFLFDRGDMLWSLRQCSMVLLEALCDISTTQVFYERYAISFHSLQQGDISLYSIYDVSLCWLQNEKSVSIYVKGESRWYAVGCAFRLSPKQFQQ